MYGISHYPGISLTMTFSFMLSPYLLMWFGAEHQNCKELRCTSLGCSYRGSNVRHLVSPRPSQNLRRCFRHAYKPGRSDRMRAHGPSRWIYGYFPVDIRASFIDKSAAFTFVAQAQYWIVDQHPIRK